MCEVCDLVGALNIKRLQMKKEIFLFLSVCENICQLGDSGMCMSVCESVHWLEKQSQKQIN